VPVTTFPRPDAEATEVTAGTGVVIDGPDVKTNTDQPKKSEGIKRPGQNLNGARSVEVELSSLERDKNAPQSFSSDFVGSDKKDRMKTHDTKADGKPQSVAIRQIQNHNSSARR